jgi:long-chain acyl-CoA synthetase
MVFPEKLTLGEMGQMAAARFARRKAFEIYGDGCLYDQLSYEEFGRRTRQFALFLISLGVKAGDRVMIFAENRPEWPVAYFGIALAGAVSVPVLTECVPGQVKIIADHAEVSALCITRQTASKTAAAALAPEIPLIFLDDMETGIPVSLGGRVKRLPLAADPPPEPGEAASPFPAVREEDLASIIYTSGTTGNPKGVMLSHRNFLFTARAARSNFKIYPRDRILSIIPLAHTYECSLGMLVGVMSGAATTYLDKPPSPTALIPAVQAIRPTAMLTVPLIIEKIYRNRILPALRSNPLYRFPPGRFILRRWAGRKLLGLFGGAIRLFSIGGAALDPETELFLRQTQFPYTLGYGMTEAAPLLAVTNPYAFPSHSAGRVLPGVELRIIGQDGKAVPSRAEGRKNHPGFSPVEGEIQVRGPNIMLGYYRDEERTQAAFTDDGWLRTGDLGCFDRKGYLYIRGRLKALILGPSGENVYPEEIEGLLYASDMVEDALVYPGERGEIVALIVLSEKTQTMLAAIGDSLEELKNAVNKRLASFSRIHRIEVQQEPFEKTATQKIKRFLYPRRDES